MQKPGVLIFLVVITLVVISPVSCKNSCKLPCRNEGVCQQREGEVTTYCQCPTGYAGALCEIRYTMCQSADQLCKNGSACQRAVDDFGKEFHHCECDTSESDLSFAYAEKLCSHASTVFCLEGDDEKRKDHKSLGGSAGGSFCTNGGVCRETEDDGKNHHHPGCTCPPGYSGQHCEHSLENSKSTKTVRLRSTSWLRSFVMFLILTTSMMLGGLMFLIHHGNRGREAIRREKKPTRVSRTNGEYRNVPEIEIVS